MYFKGMGIKILKNVGLFLNDTYDDGPKSRKKYQDITMLVLEWSFVIVVCSEEFDGTIVFLVCVKSLLLCKTIFIFTLIIFHMR